MQTAARALDVGKLRVALGLSRRELADLLCLSRQAVYDFERRRYHPRRQTIMLLRIALQDPELSRRLQAAKVPHPWPEDANAAGAR